MAPPGAIGCILIVVRLGLSCRRFTPQVEQVAVLQAGKPIGQARTTARPRQIGQPPIIPADDLTFQSAAVQSRCRYLVRGDP